MKHLTLNEVAEFLRSHDDYTILTHCRPDGDTVGSAAALCHALRCIGKQAYLSENLDFRPTQRKNRGDLIDPTLHSTVIAVDLAAPGLFPPPFSGHVDLCIDHHGTNSEYADAGYVNSDYAACGEIIYELLKVMEIPVDKYLADAIYLAVSTDTGCFKYSNTSPNSLRCAADMMEFGADTVYMNRVLFNEKSRARIALDVYLGQNIRFFGGGRIAICTLPLCEKQRLGVNEDDMDSIASFPRKVEGVQISAMLRELDNGDCKISLRAESRLWDGSKICAQLGGGGHPSASGATVAGATLEEGCAAILGAIASVTGLSVEEDV